MNSKVKSEKDLKPFPDLPLDVARLIFETVATRFYPWDLLLVSRRVYDWVVKICYNEIIIESDWQACAFDLNFCHHLPWARSGSGPSTRPDPRKHVRFITVSTIDDEDINWKKIVLIFNACPNAERVACNYVLLGLEDPFTLYPTVKHLCVDAFAFAKIKHIGPAPYFIVSTKLDFQIFQHITHLNLFLYGATTDYESWSWNDIVFLDKLNFLALEDYYQPLPDTVLRSIEHHLPNSITASVFFLYGSEESVENEPLEQKWDPRIVFATYFGEYFEAGALLTLKRGCGRDGSEDLSVIPTVWKEAEAVVRRRITQPFEIHVNPS